MTDDDTSTGIDGPVDVDHEHDADGNDVLVGLVAEDDRVVATALRDLEPGDASLLALVDRLGSLLDRSELSELAVEAGGTRLVLRKPEAVTAIVTTDPAPAAAPDAAGSPARVGSGGTPGEPPARPSVKAPLTGVWYSSPAPGSAAFVAVGREVAVGQVIGLIEAMKLFNEIKSDLAGRVVRVVPESGALVKAKQPLIEVEPL